MHDINTCPQIPPEKRIDISLPETSDSLSLPIDTESPYPAASKSLANLLAEVPHLNYASAVETKPSLVADLQKDESGAHPAHFLSPDDLDNYLHLIDNKLGEETPLPTLAPVANAEANPPVHPLLRNPNSSTSWLRQNAPHIFLQYDGDHADGHHDDEAGPKKARGGKGERGGKGAGSRGGRKSAGAKAAAAAAEHHDSNAEEEDVSLTPAPKGKRKRDDDGGYRPKGGSGARPTKKKRKSEVEGTPSDGRKKGKAAKDVGDGGD